MTDVELVSRRRLGADDAAAVLALVEVVTVHDGVRPVSDATLLAISAGEAGDAGDAQQRHVLLRRDGLLIGYAHAETSRGSAATDDVEVVLLPPADAANAGRLLAALLDDPAVTDRLGMWVHGEHSELAAVMTGLGLTVERELLQLRMPLDDRLDTPHWPDGVTVRRFVVGVDEPDWLTLNNRAFADHPEQSRWTLRDIQAREQQPWFDPSGFFLAEREGRLVGFHWTKVHPPEGRDSVPVGEVYVIGVDPAEQGGGLGRALTLHGLRHLRGIGLSSASLYVDAGNAAAMRVYDRLGFVTYDRDVWTRVDAAAVLPFVQ